MTVLEKQYCSRKTIELQNNQTGITYEELFCNHFNGATEIKILEPYLRQAYQFDNLKVLVQLLFETQGIINILLITTASDGRNNDYSYQDQIGGLNSLKEYFDKMGVNFNYEFDNYLHVRRIICNKGRTIYSDRGLHVYKQPQNALQRNSQLERLCRQTVIEYLEPIDVSLMLSSLQYIRPEADLSLEMITDTTFRETSGYHQKPKRSITIDNITNSDSSNYKLRILSDNKYLFPIEIRGKPKVYLLTFNYQGIQYDAKYSIGSKDKRRRSGEVRLGKELYERVGIKAGDRLIIRLEEDGSYTINK